MTAAANIRRAVPEDAMACARVVNGWVRATGWMPNRFSDDEMAEMIAAAIPLREVYVVGDPVSAYLSFYPEEAQISGIYVAERRAGIGKALIDHVKQDRDYIQLWTHAPNADAHRFYLREGFEKTGKTREGHDGNREFQMEWRR